MSTSTMTTSVITSAGAAALPRLPTLATQEAIVELAKQEAKVMSRVAELRKQGLWSLSRLPKVVEPERSKGQWDMLLLEMEWMAVDFAQERRWKLASCSKLAKAVVKSDMVVKREARRRREEMRKMRMASCVASIIEEFWLDSRSHYLRKILNKMNKKSDDVLELILVSEKEGMTEMGTDLVSHMGPALSCAASDSEDSSNHEQEVEDLKILALNVATVKQPLEGTLRHSSGKMDDEIMGDEPCSEIPLPDLDYDLHCDLKEFELPEFEDEAMETEEVQTKFENIDEFVRRTNTSPPMVTSRQVKNCLFTEDVLLRSYQELGVDRLLKFWQQDLPYVEIRDRGLGTKVQTAFHFSNLAANHQDWGCHLVIVKEKFDLYSWRSALAKFTPALKVNVIVERFAEGQKEGRCEASKCLRGLVDSSNVFVSYLDHVMQHADLYKTFKWKCLVLDKTVELSEPVLPLPFHLDYNHLVLYLDVASTPTGVQRLASPAKQSDVDNHEIADLAIGAWREIATLALKDKVTGYTAEGIAPPPGTANKPIKITSDEAIKVLRLITTCTTRDNVLDQLRSMNFYVLASSLPPKQASKYSEEFGALIEESPDVKSQQFRQQVDHLFNTCSHLDEFAQQTDRVLAGKIEVGDLVTYEAAPCILDPRGASNDVEHSPTSTKALFAIYSRILGLLEELHVVGQNASAIQKSPSSNAEENLRLTNNDAFDLDVLRSLANIASLHSSPSYHDQLDEYKRLMTEISDSRVLDEFSSDFTRFFLNLIFLAKPSKQSRSKSRKLNSCCSDNKEADDDLLPKPIEVIKEEAMEFDDGDEADGDVGQVSGDSEGEVFQVLEGSFLKELTSIGQRIFEEELSKFLLSLKKIVAQKLNVDTPFDRLVAGKLIVPVADSSDGVNYVDEKIVGRDKGKLTSLSLLLANDRLGVKGGRFVVTTCHVQTSNTLEWFFNLKGIPYLTIHPNSDPKKVKKLIAKFNFNLKYRCLILTRLDDFGWESVMHVLGTDALPLASNLIVLDEELMDSTASAPLVPPVASSEEPRGKADEKDAGLPLWQLVARKMSTAQDVSVFRLYYKNTIEGYQVQKRWNFEQIEECFRSGTFCSRLGKMCRHLPGDDDDDDKQSLLNVNAIKRCNGDKEGVGGNDDEDDGDDLEFIYSSHQDCLRHSEGLIPCSCSALNVTSVDHDSDDNDDTTQTVKQREVHHYALSVIDRQLKSKEISLKKDTKSPHVNFARLFQSEDVRENADDFDICDTPSCDTLLTYEVDFTDPESFISDLTGEKMPVWAPPTPPQDEDVYMDRSLLFLYESTPMSETRLPSVYVRKGNKRLKVEESARGMKSSGRDAKHDASLTCLQRPRSLFERPSTSSQSNAITLSTANSLAIGFHIDRDGRLINKAGIPVGQPYARSPTVQLPIPVPNPESQGDQIDWLIHEEWALLQAYQMISQDGDTHCDTPNQPPLQSRLPNWELIACIVNGFSRVFRSPRQCRLRCENVILPREEGRSHFDSSQRKLKKTSKGLYKTKTNRQVKTVQMYSQDNNRSIATHFSHRFDLFRNFFGKKNVSTKMTSSGGTLPSKSNHALFLSEHNINYDQPLTPMTIADLKLERANKEKEKRVAPEKVQTPSSTPSAVLTNPGLTIQQQQTSESTLAVPGASISAGLTLPIGGGVSVVLSNSQLRMAVPAVVGSQQQQQQQVILQAAAAQQQMSIVASAAASNSLLGKVPILSGVNNPISGVRNLTNFSFVVNQSAASQQGATFVTVSKAQAAVVSSVGIVQTSLSPATFKAIRNISPAAASQLAGSMNIAQNKASATAAVAFPSSIIQQNRIAIRGAGAIQLSQRLTQKPVASQQQQQTPQQQVTLTATSLAGIQKLNPVGVMSVPSTQMGQTFHVKNTQVVLKQRQQTPGTQQQQLAGATVVNRLATATSNQGSALQFQHLQLQSKPLLEVIQQQQQQQQQSSTSQQQQILATNLATAVSGINMTALIKTVSTNPSLGNVVSVGSSFAPKNILSGKVVAPASGAIRQPQVAKRPTLTAINLQGQGSRTALVGIQQVTKAPGVSQVIYQQPKVVLQPPGIVKQSPSVQLQQGAILAMTSRGSTVNISAIGLASTIATGNVGIPINPSCLSQGVVGSSQVRVAKQMINPSKVTPIVQHIAVRATQQTTQPSSSTPAATVPPSAVSASVGSTVRPQLNPSSSA